MATKDKLVNLEDLKVVNDDLQGKVTSLNQAFTNLEDDVMDYVPLFFTPMSKGTYTNVGYSNTASTKWVYSQKLGGGEITVTLASGWSAQFFKYISDSSGEQLYSTATTQRTIDASNYQFIMSARKTDNTAYTNDELAAFIRGTTVIKKNENTNLTSRMAQAESDIESLQLVVTDTESKLDVIVKEFDPETVYQVNTYAIHNNILFKRKSWPGAPVAEDWVSGHWTAIATLSDELANTVPLSYFAPYYDASQTYSAGDYVLYSGYIRKAKMDITTPETFTSGHWITVSSTLFRAIDNIEPDAVFGGQSRGIYRYPVYSTGLTISRLTTTPSSNRTGLRTGIFAIYAPTRIYVSDQTLKVRINEYTTSTTFTDAYKTTIRDYSNACDYVVYGENYPMYIAVGIMKPDSSEMTYTDLATISGQFSVMAADDAPYADLSMFQSISVSGDSWSAGAVHSIDGAPAKTVSNIGQGWAENMARQHGVECVNFAIGGTSVRTWFNYNGDNQTIGMRGLLAADAVGLYILSLGGSNDWQSGADGARGWDLGNDVHGSSTYYMGSISDISGNDYTAYPKTFYGYYGRIIEMIQAHAPNSRIIITTPNTFPTSSEKCLACYDATAEIAEHYGLPYLDLRRCDYFNYWRDGRDSVTQGVDNSIMNDKHPTAAMYSGMGRSVGKLIPEIIKENAAYFREYNGDIVTVPVTWSQVLK